ncbi:MAG: zinc ribbon domain-containing protein [Bryobacteraceae bacterium]|nr:zinc ribbon domain-containing protein [Bryobacteraceae bacterium]
MAQCSVCRNELKAGSHFCTFCGTPAQAAPAPVPTAQAAPGITCTVCQAANPAGLKFCNRCGAALSAPASAAGGFTPAKRTPLPLIIALFAIPIAGAAGWFAFQHWQKGRAAEAPVVTTAPPAPAPAPAPAPPPDAQTPFSRPVSTPIVREPEPAPAAPARVPVQRPKLPPPAPAPAPAPVQTAAEEPPAPTPAPETRPEPARAAAPAPPAEPAPARSPVFQPERTYQPAPAAPPQPRYAGPASGIIVWSGQLERGTAVTIDGDRASAGSINGALPGVPVMVEITPSDVAVAEPPGPGNGWKRISVRSRKSRHTVVTIYWRVL